MSKELICTQCGSIGKGKTVTRGNLLIEILAYFFMIIPGLIYSIWRLTTRYTACSVCGNQTLVPVDSPMGKKLSSQ